MSNKSKQTTIEIGSLMAHGDELVRVVSHTKGWVGVQGKGGDTWSVRPSQLSAAPAAADFTDEELAAATPSDEDEEGQLTGDELDAAIAAEMTEDQDGDDEPKVVVHRIGQRVVRRFHLYERTKSATGHSSRDTADATALALRGITLDQIYVEAARILAVPEAELRAKYAKLNPGMQRMNLGNRIRATQARLAEGIQV